MNLQFFERLYVDQEFGGAIGRMTLAAGRFESNLRNFLKLSGVHVSTGEATLGSLIAKLKKHDLVSDNGVEVLRELKRQRNYLIHSLFDLFSGRIEETVLPRTNLIPMDVILFAEKAWQLEENLNGLSSIVEERIVQLANGMSKSGGAIDRLFRP